MDGDPIYLTTAEAAEFCRLHKVTLETMRVNGGGPVFLKLGRKVLYARADLQAWMNSHRRAVTAEGEVQTLT